MEKVPQDTIIEEHELEEVGKGLPRPANAYNFKASTPRPAPSQIDAQCDRKKNDQIPPRRAIVRHEEKEHEIPVVEVPESRLACHRKHKNASSRLLASAARKRFLALILEGGWHLTCTARFSPQTQLWPHRTLFCASASPRNHNLSI